MKRANEDIGPPGLPRPLPGSRIGLPPCGECHLQAGELCDLCGARAPAASIGDPPAGYEAARLDVLRDFERAELARVGIRA